MSRTTHITIKDLGLNQSINLLERPEVKAFAAKHNYIGKMTQNVVLAGIRVKVDGGKDLYFPTYDKDVQTDNGQTDVVQTLNLTYESKALGLIRAGHRRDYPNLFSGDKEVLWFGIGLTATINTTTGKLIIGQTKGFEFQNPVIDIVGDCEDAHLLADNSTAVNNELQSILDGKISIDIVAEIDFKEIPEVPPVELTNPSPKMIQGGISRKVNDNIKMEMVPVTVRGNLEYEVRTRSGNGWNGHAGSFVEKDEALLFLEARTQLLRSGLSFDQFMTVLLSEQFNTMLAFEAKK